MYIYIYHYIYIDIYMYIHMFVHNYVCIYTCVGIFSYTKYIVYVCKGTYICHKYVQVSCVCVMCVCACVCANCECLHSVWMRAKVSFSWFLSVLERFSAHLYCDKNRNRRFLRFMVLKHILTLSGHFSITEHNLGLCLNFCMLVCWDSVALWRSSRALYVKW